MKSEVEDELSRVDQATKQVCTACIGLIESVKRLETLLGPKDPGEPVAPPTPPAPPAPPATGPHEYTKIRGLLADLTVKGKRTEVEELIRSFGCSKLSQVDARFHGELLEKAQALLSSVQSKCHPAIWENLDFLDANPAQKG